MMRMWIETLQDIETKVIKLTRIQAVRKRNEGGGLLPSPQNKDEVQEKA